MLFVPSILDLDEECGDGLWSREQLEEMNRRFVAAMELAFAKGVESRAATGATVRVGSSRDGKEAVIESAIESAWRWLRSNMDAGIDVSFAEVVLFVQARCSGIASARVRAGLKRRLTYWIGEVR